MVKRVVGVAVAAVLGWGVTFYSPVIKPNGTIPKKEVYYACDGDNVSPPLRWGDLPKSVKWVSIVVWDPDAPKRGGWYHWIILNIPAQKGEVPAGAGSPASPFFNIGTQWRNDYGEIGYGGPCPPPGPPHHYIFKLYLQTEKVTPPAGATPLQVEQLLRKGSIGVVTFSALYGR